MNSNPSGSSPVQFEQLPELLELDFRQLLAGHLRRTPRSNEDQRRGLHASDVLAPEADWCCRRYVLHSLFPAEEHLPPEPAPWDWRRQSVFSHGWELHRKWQKLFREAGLAVWNEAAQSYELDLTHYDQASGLFFSPDAVIRWGGRVWVVEIKGYRAEEWERLRQSPAPPERAWLQCNLYLHLLQKEVGILLIENKNTQEFFLRLVQHQPEAARPFLERARSVQQALSLAREQGTWPERRCLAPSEARARSCPLRRVCFFGVRTDKGSFA